MRSQLLKRLPILAFIGVGIWLWQGGFGFFPSERTITWRLWGDYEQVRRVEVQVWDDGDTIVKREELRFPTGVTFEPVSKVPLKPGHYTTRVFLWRAAGGEPESKAGVLEVDAETSILVE